MIFRCQYDSFHPQRLILESYVILRLTCIYIVFSLKTCFDFFNEHCFFNIPLSYCCSLRTHKQEEPNTACISYCSMRQSPETAFYFLSVYLADKSKHSSNNQKVMASFLRVNKVLQVNLQKEQQILLLKQIYSIYAD